jgi:ABC-2 type transport system ATP-binding protein
MIVARDLARRFGDFIAVEGVTFEVGAGEVFGLLGPNGAGKTTTMRMLTGLVAPSSGSAEIAGISVIDRPDDVRQVVGILTETPGLYVRLDAMENLRFFADLYGVKKPEPKIEMLLRRFGLWERRREAVGSYSKGMRQKLAIARAVVHDPKVVILDEPTSALDPESAQVVRSLITELKDEKRTIVLCTHNLDEAERLCKRIAVIKQRVLRVDTPAALRSALYGRSSTVDLVEVTDALVAVAQRVPGVRSVTVEGTRLLVAMDDPHEGNPALAKALIDAGAQLRSLREVQKTLEEVYLDLVREDARKAASA